MRREPRLALANSIFAPQHESPTTPRADPHSPLLGGFRALRSRSRSPREHGSRPLERSGSNHRVPIPPPSAPPPPSRPNPSHRRRGDRPAHPRSAERQARLARDARAPHSSPLPTPAPELPLSPCQRDLRRGSGIPRPLLPLPRTTPVRRSVGRTDEEDETCARTRDRAHARARTPKTHVLEAPPCPLRTPPLRRGMRRLCGRERAPRPRAIRRGG